MQNAHTPTAHQVVQNENLDGVTARLERIRTVTLTYTYRPIDIHITISTYQQRKDKR
jgi:hypothetical protein